MITYRLEIQLEKPDELLSRLLEDLRQYCDERGYGCLYSMISEQQAMVIPNQWYRKPAEE